MNNILNKALIPIKENQYINLLMIIVPLLNFLSGITFDLHAPSLPAIANYFSAPISAAKNTITVSMFGFAVGCILFGMLLDLFGRRRMILMGLILYATVSFLALLCSNIQLLLLIRFVQGLCVASLSVGSRTIIIDTFIGHNFKVALLYTSIAFGIGPIIAPFIGGILQYHFGWQANFITYGVVALFLAILFGLYVNESRIKRSSPFSIKTLFLNYATALRHSGFNSGIIISGISQIQLLVYTTVGSFLIIDSLHRSALVYGNSALMISCGYLLGTLTNRYFIKQLALYYLTNLGFILLVFSILLQLFFACLGKLSLFTIILPIILIGFSNGFIFPNILSYCLRLFPHIAGITTALFTCSIMVIGAVGIALVSHINVENLIGLAFIYSLTTAGQLIIFFTHLRKQMQLSLT